MNELPEHEWAPDRDFCIHCGVPAEAVEGGMVIKGCGVRHSKERDRAIIAPLENSSSEGVTR